MRVSRESVPITPVHCSLFTVHVLGYLMRSVLFVDPPAFCTALEGLVAPALRTRPLAVAPPGADRATILALSAEARLAGVERGMPVRKAQQICPDLIVLPPIPDCMPAHRAHCTRSSES